MDNLRGPGDRVVRLNAPNNLQGRVDNALDGRPRRVGDGPLNELAQSLADACETAALVRVWDALGGSQGATPATWSAVERLHSRGKGRVPDGSIRLPAAATRALAPMRRLHKICKGRRLSVRSVSADAHLARALDWVAAQHAAGRTLNATGGRPRSELAAELQVALRIDKEAARGLVTKLKRKTAL
jgi:hypothetical protein